MALVLVPNWTFLRDALYINTLLGSKYEAIKNCVHIFIPSEYNSHFYLELYECRCQQQ